MNRPIVITFFWAACGAILASSGADAGAAERWPSVGCGNTPAVQKIRAALDQPSKLEFIETPLAQVVQFLEDSHQIPIKLDHRAFDTIGMPLNAPITSNLRGISLRSGLRLILRDLELDFAVVDEVLLISTPEVAVARAEIRIYNVAELIGDDQDASGLAAVLATVLNPAAPAGGGMMPGMPGMPGMAGMGGMGGGGMFSVPEMQHGSGGHGGFGGAGHGAGHGMNSPCPGGGLGADADTAHRPPVQMIMPMKHLLIVRGTDHGHCEVADLLGALAAAMGEEATESPPAGARPSDPFGPPKSRPQGHPAGPFGAAGPRPKGAHHAADPFGAAEP